MECNPDTDAWDQLSACVDDMVIKVAQPAWDVRQAVGRIYTSAPLGVYYSPEHNKYAMYVPDGATVQDIVRVKTAVEAVGDFADIDPLLDETMVKVAYSPRVRAVGEWLNFFPKHESNVPAFMNRPSPVASMLTSGLVGAGLGYGAGWAAEKLLPGHWRKKHTRRIMGLLGGMAGLAPGAVWGMVNKANGLPFNDNRALNYRPGDQLPGMRAGDLDTMAQPMSDSIMPQPGLPSASPLSDEYKAAAELGSTLWWEAREEAFKSAFDTFGPMRQVSRERTNLDVNVDALGRTLWEVGADPQTTYTTMGALHAARQMPGGSESGLVTPLQVAQLGAHMGTGYVSGSLVGAALGLLTGMPPETQDVLKRTGMYLGVVRAVVPKLFGA